MTAKRAIAAAGALLLGGMALVLVALTLTAEIAEIETEIKHYPDA